VVRKLANEIGWLFAAGKAREELRTFTIFQKWRRVAIVFPLNPPRPFLDLCWLLLWAIRSEGKEVSSIGTLLEFCPKTWLYLEGCSESVVANDLKGLTFNNYINFTLLSVSRNCLDIWWNITRPFSIGCQMAIYNGQVHLIAWLIQTTTITFTMPIMFINLLKPETRRYLDVENNRGMLLSTL
jgi:hypothetical protein